MDTVAEVTDHPTSPPGSEPAGTARGDGDGIGAEERTHGAAWAEPAKSEPRWPSALAVSERFRALAVGLIAFINLPTW